MYTYNPDLEHINAAKLIYNFISTTLNYYRLMIAKKDDTSVEVYISKFIDNMVDFMIDMYDIYGLDSTNAKDPNSQRVYFKEAEYDSGINYIQFMRSTFFKCIDEYNINYTKADTAEKDNIIYVLLFKLLTSINKKEKIILPEVYEINVDDVYGFIKGSNDIHSIYNPNDYSYISQYVNLQNMTTIDIICLIVSYYVRFIEYILIDMVFSGELGIINKCNSKQSKRGLYD